MKKYLTAALLLILMLFMSASTINSPTRRWFPTTEIRQGVQYSTDYLNWDRFYEVLKETTKLYKIYEIYIETSKSPVEGKDVLLLEESRGYRAFKFFNDAERTVVVFVAYIDLSIRDANRYGSFPKKEYDRGGLFDDAINYWNDYMNEYDGVPMS